MVFGTYLLFVDDNPELGLNTFTDIINVGPSMFKPNRGKYLFEIKHSIIDNRFYWMECDYDNARLFKDYVINFETGEKEDNPRTMNQVETRQQLFVCFDCLSHRLYVSDRNRLPFVKAYIKDALQKEVNIKTVISSAEDFYEQVSTLHQLKFTQIDNLFSRDTDIFNEVPNFYGLDLPDKMKLTLTYSGHPINKSLKGLVQYMTNHRDYFSDVLLIGSDDDGLEKVFDLSSVLHKVVIDIRKDEHDRYDSNDVRTKLLSQLR